MCSKVTAAAFYVVSVITSYSDLKKNTLETGGRKLEQAQCLVKDFAPFFDLPTPQIL